MTEDEQGFLDFIKQQPWDDNSGRLVYADWLEEHDRLEEAERQRKYVPAERWLRDFAYAADNASYEEVIQAGADFVDRGVSSVVGGEYSLGFGAENMMLEEDDRRTFWTNWEIVTGTTVTDHVRSNGEPFMCGC